MHVFDNCTINSCPTGSGTSHVSTGDTVALTKEGLEDYNNGKLMRNIAIGAGLGLFALPVLIGGGIGLAMGGEAIGVGLAELGIIGGGTGLTVGKIVTKPRTGHLRDDKHATLSFVDMAGVVIRKSPQAGQVQVRWYAKDQYGKDIEFVAWHDAQQVYGMTA